MREDCWQTNKSSTKHIAVGGEVELKYEHNRNLPCQMAVICPVGVFEGWVVGVGKGLGWVMGEGRLGC